MTMFLKKEISGKPVMDNGTSFPVQNSSHAYCIGTFTFDVPCPAAKNKIIGAIQALNPTDGVKQVEGKYTLVDQPTDSDSTMVWT